MLLRRFVVLPLLVMLLGVQSATSCSDDTDNDEACESGSCLPFGTYVDFDADLHTARATICFDDECETALPGEGEGNVTTGFYSSVWDEGRTARVRISVFNGDGRMVGSVDEERTFARSRCACGVLFYTWRKGELTRLN